MTINPATLQPGQRVQITVNRQLAVGIYEGLNTSYNLPIVNVGGQKHLRRIQAIVDQDGQAESSTVNFNVPTQAESRRWPINDRFGFLKKMVRMVCVGRATGLIIYGKGGLGKSHNVKVGLTECGLTKGEEYTIYKGKCTPKALYRTLYENNGKIIVFDDCDSVLCNDDAVNLLKAAIDTEDERIISWLTTTGGNDEDSLPQQFEFTGKIIFISNLERDDVPQPIISRCMKVDVGMTTDEKIERLEAIKHEICPEVSMAIKTEVLAFFTEFKDRITELSMRSFLLVTGIRLDEPICWRDIAEYEVTA